MGRAAYYRRTSTFADHLKGRERKIAIGAEIARLRDEGHSYEAIEATLGLAHVTVRNYVAAYREAVRDGEV